MDRERTIELLDRLVEVQAVPGIATVVTTAEGTVLEHAAGTTGRPDDRLTDVETRYALASLTKPLVALAALQAVEEGVLELDEPLSAHLPGVAPQVTLRRALSHSSGLPEAVRLRISQSSGPEEVLARELAATPTRGPEERRTYSNVGYDLVGAAIARATEIPFAVYLREAVLEPLGMDRTSLGAPADDPSIAWTEDAGLLAHGVAQFTSATFRRLALPASGGYSTASDYARLLRLVLRGGITDTGEAFLTAVDFAPLVTNQGGALAGGVESFMTWDRADWACGFEIRDLKEPHWTGGCLTPSAVTHFGASGALCFADRERGIAACILAGRSTYSGWMLQPDAWPAIVDAIVAD